MIALLIASAACWPAAVLQRQVLVPGPWQAPSAADVRSPCPGLNTLANHAVINRSGKDITDEAIRNGFRDIYGVDESLSNTLLGQIKNLKNADGSLNLDSLRKHNEVEHDASLVHDDSFNGANWVTNQTLVNTLPQFSTDKKVLTLKDLGKYRKFRYDVCKANDVDFTFGIKQQALAYLEASTLVTVFGDAKSISLDAAMTFLGKEQLPEGHHPRTTNLITLGESSKIAAQIKFHAGIF